MRGSLVLDPLRTLVKNTSGFTLSTPSATPVVLLNVTRRPFTNTTNCVGPTAPMQSGGKDSVGFMPLSVAAVKLVPITCGVKGPRSRTGASPAGDAPIVEVCGEALF